MFKKTFFIIFSTIVFFVSGQQLPQMSQYLLDDIIFNPSSLGTKNYDRIVLHHRSQWLGFDGAPVTQFISYNGSLKENMGIGGYIMNDITGPTRRLSFNLGYAYNFSITQKSKISLGLMATLMQYGIDGNKVTLHEDFDPSIYEGYSDKSWKPDVSIGGLFYNENFYAGFSIMQLITSRVHLFKEEQFNATIPLIQHFYVFSGYSMFLNEEFKLTPSLAMHGTLSSPLQFDIMFKGDYEEMVSAAITYRYKDAIILMLGTKIKDIFLISYSFDIIVSPLRKTNSGSHEIVLGIFLKKKNKGQKSLI